MPDYLHQETSEELLNEEVTPDELREILRRLGQREFGGSPNSTIRDIAEGTSADPLVIGRILAEIRNETLQKRFGLKIEEHEERIEKIEHVQAQAPRPIPVYTPIPEFDTDEIEDLREMADKRRREKAMQPYAIILTLIGGFILLVALVSSENRGSQSSIRFNAYTTSGSSDDPVYSTLYGPPEMSGKFGGPYEVKENGTVRPATREEIKEFESMIGPIRESRQKATQNQQPKTNIKPKELPDLWLW